MVVYDLFYFIFHSDNTNIDLCTFTVKRDNRVLEFVNKTIINQVIENTGLKGDYDIIKSGDRRSIINLIKKKPYEFYWCIKLIEQDDDIINYVIQKTRWSFEYINWSLVPNFSNESKRVFKDKLLDCVPYLRYVDHILIVNIIKALDFLRFDHNLSFITNNDSNKLNDLIKDSDKDSDKYSDEYCDEYSWGIKFVNQNEELCLNAVSKYGYSLRYVKYQTNKICIAAIEDDSIHINYVKNQNRIIRLCATKINIECLKYIIKQNIELCTRKKPYLNILLPKIYKN